MCTDMRWFFVWMVSLASILAEVVTWLECDRPGVDVCAREDEVAGKEIDRTEAMSL